ncbi:MAG: class I tRNA ligase family protein [Patescibacteria group bacterium]
MSLNLPQKEKEILKFWKDSKVFENSLKKSAKRPRFVFYDGPITVNAKPGIHHVLARIFKDLIPRYKTMRGYHVERKNGWDTHGLPVELEVEKKLKFASKKDIEKYGIAKFNRECKKNVQQYLPLFKDITEKMGYWTDMDNPYITYDNKYIESLWWIIKQIWERGLLYEDFKVVPWCHRCGTGLSSHEVAQGYKRIKENSIYVKFKIKAGQKIEGKLINENTYFLAWTTTPWTLPGNLALAVNPKIIYSIVSDAKGKENYVLAKEAMPKLSKDSSPFEIGKEVSDCEGEKLVGLAYEALYAISKSENAYRVIAADFVSTKEGTGIVHIAPAFGEDDFEIGRKNNIQPLVTVNEDGTMAKGVIGEGKFAKEVDNLIVEDLKNRSLFLGEEIYEHDYPFCWRCKSPLLYYARKSWFIKVTGVKDKLIGNSKAINWFPSYVKEGRFGEWLREVKDWAFSRERYWGTPLPIWKCSKCENIEVIESLENLLSQKFTTNRYFLARHGFAQTNLRTIISSYPNKKYKLTKLGKIQVARAAKRLKKILGKGKLDFIISSDIERAVETAQIYAKEFGAKIEYDKRLREINHSKEWEGKLFLKYIKNFQTPPSKYFKTCPQGAETWNQCKMRVLNFIKEIDKKHEGKNILIVSHGDPLWLLSGAIKGFQEKDFTGRLGKKDFFGKGEIREVKFNNLPHNQEGEIDFHRPYIDETDFLCKKCESKMKRVLPICDVWFDSGAMPFAQYHYPFENKDLVDKGFQYPAEYIAEAIDQTRGWFYTLLAVSTLLDKGPSYKNVVCLGHVLDARGEKMSKSKGNIVDPWNLFEEYGADTIRWYFFTLNQPGDSKRFDQVDVRRCFNRFILTFWNIFSFWKEYSGDFRDSRSRFQPTHVLDRWIISRFYSLTKKVIVALDKYDILSASREIENFIVEDFSKWYIRRSRPRFQRPERGAGDFKKASNILGFLLTELSKLCAPFVPFFSEIIYGEMKKGNSVHLEYYPTIREEAIDKSLESKMDLVREIVSLGLQERKREGIKVRQPLSDLTVDNAKLEIDREFLNLIEEELNIKSVKVNTGKGDLKITLNTKITPSLKKEGMLREILRCVQEMRKKKGLKKNDKIEIYYDLPKDFSAVVEDNGEMIKKITLAKLVMESKDEKKLEKIEIEKKIIGLGIKKI